MTSSTPWRGKSSQPLRSSKACVRRTTSPTDRSDGPNPTTTRPSDRTAGHDAVRPPRRRASRGAGAHSTGYRGRRGRPRHPAGRDLRVPRPERRRQVDHGAHAVHAAGAHGRPGHVAGYDVATQPGEVRLRIGAALQEVALDPKQTGAELLRLQGVLYGLPKSAMAPGSRSWAAHRPHRRARPADRHVLGRHAAPARPGGGAGAQPRDPVPRRAHHRARPGEPGQRVGRGPPAQPRAGHDHLPHHPVPGGGRRAGAPGRHHRQGPHRGRGHAGRAQALGGHRRHRRARRRRRRGVCPIVEKVPGVQSVEVHGPELVIATDNGSAAVSPVAVALAACEVEVRD